MQVQRHVPGRVAGVGEREAAHAQLVHHPQRTEAVADAVPALDGDEAGDLALLEHPPDVCPGGAREGKISIYLLFLPDSQGQFPLH